MALPFLSGCHIPVEWHNWTVGKRISKSEQCRILHIIFTLVKIYKGIWKLIKGKIPSWAFSKIVIPYKVLINFGFEFFLLNSLKEGFCFKYGLNCEKRSFVTKMSGNQRLHFLHKCSKLEIFCKWIFLIKNMVLHIIQ